MNTVSQIIDACGGPDELATIIPSISKWAPRKWVKSGIPEKHWDTVIAISGVSAQDLFRANKKARANKEKSNA